jgi:L-rhamnose-H+ transport protein
MSSNPFAGLLLIAIGGLASATFYIPFKKVRGWTWETYWLVFGCTSWLLVPWLIAFMTVPDLLGALRASPFSAVALCYGFGALWGIGSLTNGLAIRYLGLSLGYAIPLGLCAALGTLLPPALAGTLGKLLQSMSGQLTLASVVLGLAGIAICAKAGLDKDRELSSAEKRSAVNEFNLGRGILLALFAGIMSAGMAFGISAGRPLAEKAIHYGTPELWQSTLLFAVLLLGGFTINAIWCITLSLRNRTTCEIVRTSAGSLLSNYLLCVLAGSLWSLQSLFYGMGESKLGKYRFAGWSVLMVSIIIFSNFWGLIFGEWKGTSRATRRWLVMGLLVLTFSSMLTGYGSYLADFEP